VGGWGGDDDAPPSEATATEAANAVEQAKRMLALIDEACANPTTFAITPELICELNRLAVTGLVDTPGALRSEPSQIIGSKHVPPPAAVLHGSLQQMCVVLTTECRIDRPIEEAAPSALYWASWSLWWLNWLHPFEDGNGRTARAVSYLVLCWRFRRSLRGTVLVPERIARSRRAYQHCLDDADAEWKQWAKAQNRKRDPEKRFRLTNLLAFMRRHVLAQLENR